MRHAKKSIAAAVALIVVAALATAWFHAAPKDSSRSRQADASTRLRVYWPANHRFNYALAWHAHTAGEVSPGAAGKGSTVLDLDADVEGEIALERAGGTDAAPLVALSYTRFDKFSFDMQGQDSQAQVEAISKALAGQTAFLSIDERGRIGSIAFPPEMDPSARSVLRSLALQLGYTLPQGSETSWEADEGNSLGEAHVRYRRGLNDFAREPLAFTKLDVVRGALDGKQSVQGGAMIAVDANGLPLSIDETVDALYTRPDTTAPAVHSGWTFTLSRKSEGPGDAKVAANAARAKAQPLRSQVDDPERDKRHDQHMAQGMSAGEMALMFDRFEDGTRPGHQFLVRAAAWLRLHPEDLPLVLAKFNSEALTVKGRGLILDVLAETGNAQAQEAMRNALSGARSHAKPGDFSILVQRFTFVIAPDAKTVRFLEETYDAQKRAGDVLSAQGAVVALGSVVRRLAVQHELAEANEVNDKLRAELRDAQTPEMKAALVAALGNAARADDVTAIAAIAGDPDMEVRGRVASALRSVDSPEARQALFSLVADSSTGVANSALDALRAQSLGDSDWQALQQIAQQGSSPVSSDAALLNLVREKDKAVSRPEARTILTAMLARNQGGDNDLPGLIRGLLSASN